MEESAQVGSPEESGGGGKFLKIVLIVFALAILVLVSEFVYITFSRRSESTSSRTSAPAEEEGRTVVSEEGQKGVNVAKAFAFADLVQSFKDLGKEEFIQSAGASLSVRGNVLEAGVEEREIDGALYRYKIKIENATKDNAVSFPFTNQEIESATIIFVSGDKAGQKLKIEDIKPGYFVSMKIVSDLLDRTTDYKLFLEVSSFGQ